MYGVLYEKAVRLKCRRWWQVYVKLFNEFPVSLMLLRETGHAYTRNLGNVSLCCRNVG